jgi:predicted DCC family thiol-disulfide oxidoreductase YuxK
VSKPKVYFNSACPVCNAGIRWQRRRMPAQICAVDWLDVHRDHALVRELGTDLESVRRKLYVVDERGVVHVGADAFTYLWKHTPGWRWLGRLFSMPILRSLGRITYDGWAALLYRWNRYMKHW